jgi:hypothetical protein
MICADARDPPPSRLQRSTPLEDPTVPTITTKENIPTLERRGKVKKKRAEGGKESSKSAPLLQSCRFLGCMIAWSRQLHATA